MSPQKGETMSLYARKPEARRERELPPMQMPMPHNGHNVPNVLRGPSLVQPPNLFQITQLMTIINFWAAQHGLTAEQMQELLSYGYLGTLIEAATKGTLPGYDDFRLALGLEPSEYCLPVDYDTFDFATVITMGGYHSVDQRITKGNFPVMGVGRFIFRTRPVCFNEDVISDEAERRLNTSGLYSSGIEEILLFGVFSPNVRHNRRFVALGATAELDGVKLVVCLHVDDEGRRHLVLHRRDEEWMSQCHFLASPGTTETE